MTAENKSTAHRACRTVLRPLASMLLRCGMTWREFSELSKAQFVRAATEEFGIRGRPTNVSRVSILTGISRKEVKRQRDLLQNKQSPVKTKTTDATRVLSAWFQDPDYVDENSVPKLLKESGPKPSFESLCADYGGDIAMPTMLKELLNTETIERTQNGLLRPMRRFYQPVALDDESVLWAAELIKDLSETTNDDLFRESKTPPRFVRKAENKQVRADSLEEFRALLRDRGQAFLVEIDDWLTEHEINDGNEPTETIRLGVGLFAIQDKI